MTIEHAERGGDDVVRLRFVGADDQGVEIQDLPAAHVAEVLQGLVGLSTDFGKAGVFGEGIPPQVRVRPPSEGSFVLEVINWVSDNQDVVATVGMPSLGTIIWYATKSMRADVSDIEYLENGNVKISWQDDTIDEVPREVWDELRKRTRRRKKQLRQIMAPLSDPNVSALQVSDDEESSAAVSSDAPAVFTLERTDYHLVRPSDEIEEAQQIFEIEARMSAIDFDSAERWRVRTPTSTRTVTVEDDQFLRRVDSGLAIHKNDIFTLLIREDATTKNERKRRRWTVLQVKSQRRGAGDVDDA